MGNKQIENMENIFNMLGDMKLTKKQRSQIAEMLRTAFVNGLHTALIHHSKINDECELMSATSQDETYQQVDFLTQYNSK